MTEQRDWRERHGSQVACVSEYLTELETLPPGTKLGASHHRRDRLEERDVERGSARRSFLKERERAIVNQTNI